jgi:hypothetical protein
MIIIRHFTSRLTEDEQQPDNTGYTYGVTCLIIISFLEVTVSLGSSKGGDSADGPPPRESPSVLSLDRDLEDPSCTTISGAGSSDKDSISVTSL